MKTIYSKETRELLDGAPDWTWEFLDDILKGRSKAKKLEDQAADMKKDAHEKMEVIWVSAKMWPSGLDKLSIKSSLGNLVYQAEGESQNLDKKKLMEEMMKAGLTAKVVDKVMKAATKTPRRASYSKYTPPKGATI